MDRGFSARLILKKFYLIMFFWIVGSVYGFFVYVNGMFLYVVMFLGVIEKLMLMVLKIFFLGLSVGSASSTKFL